MGIDSSFGGRLKWTLKEVQFLVLPCQIDLSACEAAACLQTELTYFMKAKRE